MVSEGRGEGRGGEGRGEKFCIKPWLLYTARVGRLIWSHSQIPKIGVHVERHGNEASAIKVHD